MRTYLDLAKKTETNIVFGTSAKSDFESVIAEDNQEFKVGEYTIKAIHTPKHTMELTTYLLIDETGEIIILLQGIFYLLAMYVVQIQHNT